MILNDGDIITFPNCADTRGAEINSGRVYYPNGVPGKWRVIRTEPDGTIKLESVKE